MNTKHSVGDAVVILCFPVMFLVMVIILSWEFLVVLSDSHISLIGKDVAFLLILSAWGVVIYVFTNAVIYYMRKILHARRVKG